MSQTDGRATIKHEKRLGPWKAGTANRSGRELITPDAHNVGTRSRSSRIHFGITPVGCSHRSETRRAHRRLGTSEGVDEYAASTAHLRWIIAVGDGRGTSCTA